MGEALILLWLNGIAGSVRWLARRGRCLAYRGYDRAKSSVPMRLLVFHGGRYRHFGQVTVVGKVISISGGALDGDWTFNIQAANGSQLHCEITPCFPVDVSSLSLGDTVRVSGTSTYDPAHFDIPGHWEIHPVKSLDIVKGAV